MVAFLAFGLRKWLHEIFSWLPGRTRLESMDHTLFFLSLAGLSFFGLTVIWNPDLGPKRDWDLFGQVAFLLLAPLVALVVNRFKDNAGRAFHILLLIGCVNITRSIPWILFNATK